MQQQEGIQGSFLLSESVGDSAFCGRLPACQSYLKGASDLEPGSLCMAEVTDAPEQDPTLFLAQTQKGTQFHGS